MGNEPKVAKDTTALPSAGEDIVRLDQSALATSRVEAFLACAPQTFVEQVTFDLNQPRPAVRPRTPVADVLKMRRIMFEKFPELESRRQPELAKFTKNMCSVLGLWGYRSTMIEKVPELGEAIAAVIKSEFEKLKDLGIRPSAIARRGHLRTYAQFEDTVIRAPQLFDRDKKERSKARFMVDLVVRGLYPDIESLHLRYVSLKAEAGELFGAHPDTVAVTGTAVSLVLRGHRESISECLEIYKKALRDGARIAKREAEFEPLIRTMAGFVMAGRYKSMDDGATVYIRKLGDVKTQFSGLPEAETLVRTTAVLLLKGAYKNATQARDRWQTIHADMEREIERNPNLRSVAKSIELLVYSKNYKSVSQAVKRYESALVKAESLFEADENGRTFARTAAHLVIQLRFKSVGAVFRAHKQLMREAMALCGEGEEGAEVAKTLVIAVLKNSYPSMIAARDAYLDALDDCTEKFGAHPTMARSAALQVLLKRHENGAAALKRYIECRHESERELAGDARTAPIIAVFADMLFRESISSAAEGKTRYLQTLLECEMCFAQSDDTKAIVRTAALLVFRNVYPNARAAYDSYLDMLEAARKENGYAKSDDGEDAPGIRTLAMKCFETRSLPLAA